MSDGHGPETEDTGAAALLTPRSALPGPLIDRQGDVHFDHTTGQADNALPPQVTPRGQSRQSASPPPSHSNRVQAGPLPPLDVKYGSQATCNGRIEDVTWTPTLLLATAPTSQARVQRFLRFGNLSLLGWSFVFAAFLWERFAYAFSQCLGCGWREGGFFCAWGLGSLQLGST
jgi:hypothetical protein